LPHMGEQPDPATVNASDGADHVQAVPPATTTKETTPLLPNAIANPLPRPTLLRRPSRRDVDGGRFETPLPSPLYQPQGHSHAQHALDDYGNGEDGRAPDQPNSSWRTIWDIAKIRARYYIPALAWIPTYNRSDLLHDVLAGATVAFVLIPQGLSYAITLAKLDPITGLYTGCFPVLVYGLFGTSRQLSIGPEALVSILVGSAVTQNLPSGLAEDAASEASAAIAGTLCLLVGLFTFLLGFFRFGFLDSVLSRALLRGFILAVAIVIIIEQAPPLLGLAALSTVPSIPIPANPSGNFLDPPSPTNPPVLLPPGASDPGEDPSPFDKLLIVLSRMHETHIPTLLVSILSISFLTAARAIKAKLAARNPTIGVIPEILALVICAITLSWWTNLHDLYNVPILGTVKLPAGKSLVPFPSLPNLTPFSLIRSLTIPAALISILGFVESIVVTKQYASAHNYPVSRNRELVALGVANLAGSLFGAFPAFGSLTRSRVNDRAGARTQLAAMSAGILVLLTVLVLLPVFYHLPKAVMASIIFVAATSLIELDDVKFILQLRAWKDLACLVFTFIVTLFVSIEAGILSSIALSLLLVVKDVAMPKITLLEYAHATHPGADLNHRVALGDGVSPTSAAASAASIKPSAYRQVRGRRRSWSPTELRAGNGGAHGDRLAHTEYTGRESIASSSILYHRSASPMSFNRVDPDAEVLASATHRHSSATATHAVIARSALTETHSPPPHHLAISISSDDFGHEHNDHDASLSESVVVVRIDEALHFANTGELRERLLRAERFGTMAMHPSEMPTRRHPLRLVVFDVGHMSRIDASAAQVIRDISKHYRSRGVGVAFARVRPQVEEILDRAGITKWVVLVDRVADAVRACGLVVIGERGGTRAGRSEYRDAHAAGGRRVGGESGNVSERESLLSEDGDEIEVESDAELLQSWGQSQEGIAAAGSHQQVLETQVLTPHVHK
ncbi:sulfate transporter family-domain-containing protein, partial [Catenaria anguillulae PL171]